MTSHPARKRRKLVLHLDVNNTVFIGDSITKQVTPESALNEYLVDVVWGKLDTTGSWKSADNSLHDKPPDQEAISYYRFAQSKYNGKPRKHFKTHIRNFTEEEIGKPFRSFYSQMLTALEFPGDLKCSNGELPSFKDNSGKSYHCIVPSFYKLLDHLFKSGREFAIVFRTFGGDGQIVLKAARDFIDEMILKNPQHHQTSVSSGKLVDSSSFGLKFTTGTVTQSNDHISLEFPGEVTLSNSWDIYTYFSHSTGIQLVVDDYSWWKAQDFCSTAAKPLLIDPCDESVHHIMFDDNFRPWEPEDSIVNVLAVKDKQFCTVDPAIFDNMCVVKADLYQSICNENYFVDKIEACERNYQKFVLESENKEVS